ncbi:bifunctional dihydrofolate reductase-thymidylate synthase [Reticulomyxa filosa]|uniref:Bifunctional dihydrofolate reductase-thymidylate synthase n=1 Tax=Reticulomyxa filosa TaxID=46433 RepID=X6MWZ6_RETFI|nr:bifunctional dihydrofolate reductase-thymidylate synthase [Reticulomyxa filosa]|eukprot:ETO17992.1 bifunctional dihydrofolate reductase-thymidylate synthase [Reticulomyxa filosa]
MPKKGSKPTLVQNIKIESLYMSSYLKISCFKFKKKNFKLLFFLTNDILRYRKYLCFFPVNPFMRNFSIIVAATFPSWGIGSKGELPWKIAKELQYFKKTTTTTTNDKKKNAVIMGRKTWESIPPKSRPLKDRLNVVLTKSDPDSSVVQSLKNYEGVLVCGSLDEALEKLSSPPYNEEIEQVFVIGGGQIYTVSFLHEKLEHIYLTKIFKDIGCDTFLDHFRNHKQWNEEWEEKECSVLLKAEEKDNMGDLSYQYFQLQRKQKQQLEQPKKKSEESKELRPQKIFFCPFSKKTFF